VGHRERSNGLTLHPEKTHVGDCRQRGEGFEFLGYRFEGGQRFVRRKSRQKIRDRIREATRRTRGDSLSRIVADLNPILKGWYGYFRHAHQSAFRDLDGFVRRRLRAILRKQQKSPSHGRARNDQQRWPNHYFARMGLFSITTAHRLACQSR
jgi:RNA-directed DNA polymerase